MTIFIGPEDIHSRMFKPLIGIIGCHKNKDRADAQRRTWMPMAKGFDVKFFVGIGEGMEGDDVVQLDVLDDYWHLTPKTRMALQWALDNGYSHMVKADDDGYIVPDRLMEAIDPEADYIGRLRGPANGFRAPYASGFCYILSRRAMELRIAGDDTPYVAEDQATGNILLAAGVQCKPDYRIVVAQSKHNATSAAEGPTASNDYIAACEYTPEQMDEIHRIWLSSPANTVEPPRLEGEFDRVCVQMKCLLRDGLMYKSTAGILANLPGARLVLIDDGVESREKITYYAKLRQAGHTCAWMPFDSGFGAKSNEAIQYYDRPYVLIASDDFDFTPQAAEGIRKMMAVLDGDPAIDIASGRVDDNPYEAELHVRVREDGLLDISTPRPDYSKMKVVSGVEYLEVGLTVNYNLMRKEVFEKMRWDDEFKIGGDHGLFYLKAKERGLRTAWVKGVSISQLRPQSGDCDPRYGHFRGRARHSLPRLYKKYGWWSWTGMDGVCETMETAALWSELNTPRAVFAEPRKSVRKQLKLKRRDEKKRAATLKKLTRPERGKYCIDPAYKMRSEVPHFDDTPFADEYQKEVYELARAEFDRRGFETVLDIGCGGAYKLLKYFGDQKTAGIEVEPTLSWLKAKYPDRLWRAPQCVALPYDMVICSDVIEHVEDPDALLEQIKAVRPKLVVISTPDRTLLNGPPLGPPKNIHHRMEFTAKEFCDYIGRHFKILLHEHTNRAQGSQCILATL